MWNCNAAGKFIDYDRNGGGVGGDDGNGGGFMASKAYSQANKRNTHGFGTTTNINFKMLAKTLMFDHSSL